MDESWQETKTDTCPRAPQVHSRLPLLGCGPARLGDKVEAWRVISNFYHHCDFHTRLCPPFHPIMGWKDVCANELLKNADAIGYWLDKTKYIL